MDECKMALSDNGGPEEFLLSIRKFKMTLKSSVTISANAKLQCLHNLLCGYSLSQFDNFCAQLFTTTMAHLNRVILGLGTYFPPVNALSKKNPAMCRGMRK